MNRDGLLTAGKANLEFDPFVEALADALSEFFSASGQLSAETAIDKNETAKKILVAFSGGPDSTALLLGLAALKNRLNLELSACHVNHGVREEAASDAEFCRKVCEELQIPLKIKVLPALDSYSEESLRNARYESLSDCALEWHCRVCVTGHTADDQAETILFRLFRGTYPAGIIGIPEMRLYRAGLMLLRPLLRLKHDDCVRYLSRLGIKPCIDGSNQETTYSRNYIRHKIMPVIEERFPGFAERLLQFASLVEIDERYIAAQMDESCCNEPLANMPLALRRRLLIKSLVEHEVEPSHKRLEALLEMLETNKESVLSLSKRWDLKVRQKNIYWIDKNATVQESPGEFEFELSPKGQTLIAPLNMMISFKPVSLNQGDYPGSKELEILADLSAITSPLKLRLRQPGDRIRPLGMQSIVRLKKYLHTHKSDGTLTFGGLPVVLADQEEVLWVPGCGISEKIAVKTQPTHRVSFMKLAADPVFIS